MIGEFSFLGFPLSGNEVRKIAFDFTEANGFGGFSKIHSEAGRKWFSFLLKWYPQLKVKDTIYQLQGQMLQRRVRFWTGIKSMKMC